MNQTREFVDQWQYIEDLKDKQCELSNQILDHRAKLRRMTDEFPDVFYIMIDDF